MPLMAGAYNRPDGLLLMQPSVVCYADVLGYKQLVREAIANDEGNTFLRRIDGALRLSHQTIRQYAHGAEAPRFDVKVFTDNIVVGYPALNGGFAERELIEVLEVFAWFQATMAVQGFLVRGGVAFDQHYMDENVVLGPGLLDCVGMDTSGGAPRLAFAKSAMELVDQHTGFYHGPQDAPVSRYVLRDADGVYFLNYLSTAFFNFDVSGVDLECIRGHASSIKAGLNEYAGNSGIRSKYEWAARYHNFICLDFATRNKPTAQPDADPYLESLREEAQCLTQHLIDVESLAVYPTQLS